MTESSKNGNDKQEDNNSNNQSTENLFKIMDGIIQQLNNTKKMFIIMIITIMIIPPLSLQLPMHYLDHRSLFKRRNCSNNNCHPMPLCVNIDHCLASHV